VRHRLALAGLLLVAFPSHAQQAIDGQWLGMDAAQLTNALPGIQRLGRAVAGPRGLKGFWRAAHTPVAGLLFDTTFFTKGRQVLRIEQQGASTDPRCGEPLFYAPLMATMDAKYGRGLVSLDLPNTGASHQSVVWEAGGFDVLLHLSRAHGRCSALVIYEPHLGKDASEL
jgi:hypothetical protein